MVLLNSVVMTRLDLSPPLRLYSTRDISAVTFHSPKGAVSFKETKLSLLSPYSAVIHHFTCLCNTGVWESAEYAIRQKAKFGEMAQ